MQELLVLEPDECQFLSEFKDKHYKPELIFDDAEILERIKEHPMALWKIRN